MCHAVRCRICGKTTWAGCGQHVQQVMRAVPEPARCPGHLDRPTKAKSRLRGLFGGR